MNPSLPRFAIAIVAGFALFLSTGVATATDVSSFDNGVIRVGVDLRRGGAISLLQDLHHGGNVINTHDPGRYVSQSYYSGPKPFGDAHPGWKDWPWNPVSGGDAYGNASEILQTTFDGRCLYVKSRPLQWALNRVPGDCAFETWISLDGHAANVRCRLTSLRDNHTQYPAMDQELPAVYTIGSLHRLFTYAGERPFTDDILIEVPKLSSKSGAPRWSDFVATECWAALVDQDDWGLGVIHPGVVRFLGGFYGTPGAGGSTDDATGYMAPIRKEILDHHIVYEHDFRLVLDTLKNIRAQAAVAKESKALPDYRFDGDRRHWWYQNITDAGYPIVRRLVLDVGRDDPQMIGPESAWLAKDAPRLWVRAALHTTSNRADIYWQNAKDPGFSAEHRVAFSVTTDGQFHTYEIDLSAERGYAGLIRRLRFDPVDRGQPGETVEIESIGFRRPDPSPASTAPTSHP